MPYDHDIRSIVDLEKYPLNQPQIAATQKFIDQCRNDFVQSGLCILPDFLRPKALRQMANEVESWGEQAYFCDSSHNAYLDDGQGKSGDDVRNRQQSTFVGSIPFDRIPGDSMLGHLYQWDPLKNFIGEVLGKRSFFRFADPFGACSVNVFVDGGQHGWHFDESEFTTTLMVQAPETGGEFEYVPMIRGLDDEQEIVQQVLDGNRQRVTKLPFTPGTLLIFGGNKTLHRVTRVQGNRPRLVPVLCFAEKPGMQNSESVRKLFWGRANPGDA